MANEEQLSILKQGVEVWNKWRRENPEVEIDLARADLSGADLHHANFLEADLAGADLSNANLAKANLRQASLFQADLSQADLIEANFIATNLSSADLTRAFLGGAEINSAELNGADLRQGNLTGTEFIACSLTHVRLNGAVMGGTSFLYADLSRATGLEAVEHVFNSHISTDTIQLSKGKIPEVFLRGAGLSDWEIEMVKLYNPDLGNEERNKILHKVYDLQASQPIQISPLFISYSHGDGEFVTKIDKFLTKKGIRFWRDLHDMKAGLIEKQIDRAIRQNPTVLLVLSSNSLSSDWVEHEVRVARELQKEMGRDVLCPVALDASWKDGRWPKRVMEQIMEYNILDFSEWQDDVKFEGMFRKLIDGLELFYKG